MQQRFDRPKTAKRIDRPQRVIEKCAVVVDARQPGASLEVVTEYVFPPLR